MTIHTPIEHARGSAPVGRLCDLPALDTTAVIYLRLWCHAPETQAHVWNDYVKAFGPERARRELQNFEKLMSLMLRHARRPLMHHQIACKCLGADESVFATFIATAAATEREDAMLMATLLVRPEVAASLVNLAEKVGMGLRQLCRRCTLVSHNSSAMVH